jgi:hypothetical protein
MITVTNADCVGSQGVLANWTRSSREGSCNIFGRSGYLRSRRTNGNWVHEVCGNIQGQNSRRSINCLVSDMILEYTVCDFQITKFIQKETGSQSISVVYRNPVQPSRQKSISTLN